MMETRKKTTYKLEIRPLTAVSINNGNTIDIASYVIGKDKCIVIDINKLISRVMQSGTDAEKHSLTVALDNSADGLNDLKAFVSANYKEDDVLYSSTVSRFTLSALQKNKGNLNINEIYRNRINNVSVPVIPGSSIKGAIRTAFTGQASVKSDVLDDEVYSNLKNKIKNLKNIDKDRDRDRESQKIESEIDARILFSKSFLPSKDRAREYDIKDKDGYKTLIAPQHSAMKNLQISDCFPEKIDTEFLSLAMPGRNMSKALPIVDSIRGSLMGTNSVFKGTLRLCPIQDISHQLTIENIIADCNTFCKKTFKREKEVIIESLRARENDFHFDLYDELEHLIMSPLRNNQFLLRIGRFSQREYMTYSNDFRFVKSTKNDDEKWGCTRTMRYDGDQYLPLGWCLCCIE